MDDDDSLNHQQSCPFCGTQDDCEHLALLVDRTYQTAEAGDLMDVFNSRYFVHETLSLTQITITVTIDYVIASDERTKSRSSIITDGENTYGYNSQTQTDPTVNLSGARPRHWKSVVLSMPLRSVGRT
jgi:hypothetical protein